MKHIILTLSILLLFIACDNTKTASGDKTKSSNLKKLTLEDTQKGKLTIQQSQKIMAILKILTPKKKKSLKISSLLLIPKISKFYSFSQPGVSLVKE